MQLTSLLSTPAVGWWRIALLLALAGSTAGVTWWGLSPRIDIQAERAGRAEKELVSAMQTIEHQVAQLDQQREQLEALAAIERRMQLLGQTVTRNADAQAQAFEELKRNDETIAAYLAGSVPHALGRLYERPETTDPSDYRSSSGVRSGAVPSAGSPSGVD